MSATDTAIQALQDSTNTMINAYNVAEQKKANQNNYDIALKNLALSTEQQEYMRALQERLFERDDTSMQRMINDYTMAGINPLLGIGKSAANTTVSQPSAPQLNYEYKANRADFLHFQYLQNKVLMEQEQKLQLEKEYLQKQNYGQDLSNVYQSLRNDELQYNNNYYMSQGLPTNQTGITRDIIGAINYALDWFGDRKKDASRIFEEIKPPKETKEEKVERQNKEKSQSKLTNNMNNSQYDNWERYNNHH